MKRAKAKSLVAISYGYGDGCVGFGGPARRRTFMTVESGGREIVRVPLCPWVASVLIRELETVAKPAPKRARKGKR